MTIPRATVRLQMHAGFTLGDAEAQIPYLAELGVSHLYLSPVSQARPGSTHGYDVVDHEVVNRELGGEDALLRLAHSLRARDMGLILDIVPNHMATHQDNRWWWDVLQHGQASPYADWFDIDWRSPEPGLHGKVLAPFLGETYAHCLTNGAIALVVDDTNAQFQIKVYDALYPLDPGSVAAFKHAEVQQVLTAHDPATQSGVNRLHELLEQQHYRLCWWRCAADTINWRRFFEISDLIGVRVEDPAVFDAVHALPLRLFEQGIIDGVRIDHVDGLAQPLAYCRLLRDRLTHLAPQRPGKLKNDEPWLIVEKILAPSERLDERWAVDGSSGYDFMDQAGAVLHGAKAEEALISHWNDIAGSVWPVATVLEDARRLMLDRHFAAERKALLRALSGVAQSNVSTRDWSTEVIARVLELVLQKFPVYRSYVENDPRGETDQAWFEPLLEAVRAELDRRRDAAGIQLLPVLDGWLAGACASSENSPAALALQRKAIRRFQQLTPPLAAKSLEDTTFYRYGRLLSRNEVGSDPAVFALSVDEFHQRNATRLKQGAKSMLATATHDHKRGEDVRARLAVLTEVAPMWTQCARRWLDETRAAGENLSAIHASERYMLLQMVVGAWPLGLSADDEAGRAAYAERLIQWQEKALREGKQSSSWFDPDLQHEEASADYVRALLTGAGPGPYREIAKFVDTIAPAAAVNSLTQVVLRMTSPGIPDLYQGTELWDFSLVDPDNRRPVDFALRREALYTYLQRVDIDELLSNWRSGRIKQFVVFRTLQMLGATAGLFRNGDYLPLPVTGVRSEHAMAYARRLGDEDVVVVVPRLIFSGIDHQAGDTRPVISAEFWGDSTVSMPPRSKSGQWLNIFHDARLTTEASGTLRLADVFAGLPVAILRST